MTSAITQVALYNQAISLAGGRATVASISEASREAETCELFFEDVRNRVLHAAPWPSCRAVQKLNLLYERDTNEDWENFDPPPGFKYSFQLPSDLLRPRYLSTFERFILGVDQSDNKLLHANREDTILVYTKLQTDIELWDHQLKMAIMHALAAYICEPLGGKYQKAERRLRDANDMLMQARLEHESGEEYKFDVIPSWIAARGYGGYPDAPQYVYPSGPLLTLTAAPVT